MSDAPELRSKAIREFCDKAGIKPSVEVAGLPDDVKRWRMETAVAARKGPPWAPAPQQEARHE